ncbi:hypothetical protein MLD38_007148 [Melastoma candidum]|uniref:Uncharacterized protein n=1 Tax=Melastoma candidum TaxID=119954 RepID=A0ACB9RPP4_9MYRT|nr:hypothetical protein MLD38_007148 [Melastoma candidum]
MHPINKNLPPPSLSLLLYLKESGHDLFQLSLEELWDRLRGGLILSDKENAPTKLFWMDGGPDSNFLLLPKALTINTDSFGNQGPQHGQDSVKLGGNVITVPTVKYNKTRYVRVSGKLGWVGLSPSGAYKVVLYLKLNQRATEEIRFATMTRLSSPDGTQTRVPWSFGNKKASEKWDEFPVGTFQMKPNNVGELSFEIHVYFWGRPDITIKGVDVIKIPPP